MSTEQEIRRPQDNLFTRFLNWGSSNPNAGASGSKTNPIQFSQITTTGKRGGSMNPYLTLGMGAVGGLMGYMNKPQDIGFTGSMQNFGTAGYAPNLDLLRSIRGVGNRAKSLDNMGSQFMDQYSMMIDPNSAYNQQLGGRLREQVGDTTAQTVGNQNMMLAQRGMGVGGMNSVLSGVTGNRANEQIRTGLLDIQQNSLAGAGQFGGMATGAVGTAGNLAATAAGLRGDIDARTLQNEQFNTQAKNQYQQYVDMGTYNAQVQNQNAQAAFGDNLLNYAGGLASLFV
tara:strand:+ start:1845 stop:2699 length:855 start_codon:yes stop_codon:yes gene_type:complete